MEPLRLTEIGVFSAPDDGVRVSVGAGETVKMAKAELPAESVTVTEWAPPDEVGTAKVTPTGIAPPAVEVTVAGLVVRALPSYVKVNVELAANPVPVTVTVVPSGPLVGLRAMAVPVNKVTTKGSFCPIGVAQVCSVLQFLPISP